MAFSPSVRALSDCRMDFCIVSWDFRKLWRASLAWGIKKEQNYLGSEDLVF
jgi:hypothetical protein